MKTTLLIFAPLMLIAAIAMAGPAPARSAAPAAPARAARPAAPAWAAHPVGMHPHGAIVRPHAVRVLAPRVVIYGNHGSWRHWGHPEFVRPLYYWNWASIHQVTCIAEDSYGDQYPVTVSAVPGWGLENMSVIEDDALDRCYEESGQDGSCYLATCTHY